MQPRAYRYPCDHPVAVLSAQGRESAVVINISTEGARLARVAAHPEGDLLRVELTPGAEPRLAEVRWSRGRMIGLRFARPLAAVELAQVRKTPVGKTGPVWAQRHGGLREMR